MRPTRRTLLGACAAGVVGLAGCVGGTGGEREVAVGESAATGGREVTVRSATVQESVYERRADGTLVVRSPGEGQYVFADLAVEGGEIDPSNLALVGDDRRVEGFTDYRLRPDRALAGESGTGVYDDRDGAGWVGFRAPGRWVGEAPRLRLSDDDGPVEWTLRAGTVERLRAPRASLSLSDWDFSAYAPGEPFSATVAAENDGDGAGAFRFALTFLAGETGEGDRGRVRVGPGAERETALSVDCHADAGDRELVSFLLQVPGDEVRVRPGWRD